MTIQDPIANLFSSISNAHSRLKRELVVPASTKKVAIVKLLQNEGYIDSFQISDEKKPKLTIKLKYFEGKPAIKEFKRISRPGLREYSRSKGIPSVKGGLGTVIVSTSQGLMTDKKAREIGIGGEIICSVF